MHLPCIHSSKEKITQILQKCKEKNLNQILALRGDICENLEKSKDFSYASDLISFIKKQEYFEIMPHAILKNIMNLKISSRIYTILKLR